MNQNMKAFLDMVAWAELGKLLDEPEGENGYKIMFGSTVKYPIIFRDYSDHPRVKSAFYSNGARKWSSAAGRYQFAQKTYDYLHRLRVMPDMTPDSQDRGAVSLIAHCDAIEYINVGDIRSAIKAVRKQWASMPGAGYDQPEKSIDTLLEKYLEAGGSLSRS